MQPPRFEILPPKKLIGKRLRMTLSNNKISDLWRSFMPNRKEILNKVSEEMFSVQVFDDNFDFRDFTMETEFERWAAMEVSDFSEIPPGMEAYTMKGGLYAVFLYKGASNAFHNMFQYIYKEWLPSSGYQLDKREHFELIGEKYKNNDPSSEEEIWIPVKRIG